MNNGNGILIINRYEIDILKSIPVYDYTGYVYIIQRDDGAIKIGCTKNPHQRISRLVSAYEHYGDKKIINIAVSKEHINYSENENKMHNIFSEFRKANTELFCVDFGKAVHQLEQLSFEILTPNIKKSIEQRNERNLEYLKGMIGCNAESNQERRINEDKVLMIETTCNVVEYIKQLIDMKEFLNNPPCRLLLIAALSNVIAEKEILPLDYEALKPDKEK